MVHCERDGIQQVTVNIAGQGNLPDLCVGRSGRVILNV